MPATTGLSASGMLGSELLAIMLLALHEVVMNLGVEGLLDETGGSGELDKHTAVADIVHVEAMVLTR